MPYGLHLEAVGHLMTICIDLKTVHQPRKRLSIYGLYQQMEMFSLRQNLANNFYMFSVIKYEILIHLQFVSYLNPAERVTFYQLDDHFSNLMMRTHGSRQRLLLFLLVL